MCLARMIRRADVLAETREFAVHPAVSPGWVHPCEPQQQVLDLVALPESAGHCLRAHRGTIFTVATQVVLPPEARLEEGNWDASLSGPFSGFGRT
jgi:hypothetical protein